MADSQIIPFNPSPSANFQFQATLDGAVYNCICRWNVYDQRYYLFIYDLTQTLVLLRPVTGSPDTANISLTAGYFDTTVIYRDSRAVFEIPGQTPLPLVTRPPAPPTPPPPPPPPPAPDPYFDDVVLLLHGEGSQGSTTIQDSSSWNNVLTTNGTVTIDDTTGEFTGGCLKVSTGNWLWSAANPPFDFNGIDYTLEGWFYLPTLISSDGQSLFCFRDEHTFDSGQLTVFVHADGTVEFYSADAFGDDPVGYSTPAGAFPAEQWVFVSVTQHITGTVGGTVGTHYTHVNGVPVGSYTGHLSHAMSGGVNIGNYGRGAADQSFNGWMQEYRLTAGVARYGAEAYSVPTSRFPNSGP